MQFCDDNHRLGERRRWSSRKQPIKTDGKHSRYGFSSAIKYTVGGVWKLDIKKNRKSKIKNQSMERRCPETHWYAILDSQSLADKGGRLWGPLFGSIRVVHGRHRMPSPCQRRRLMHSPRPRGWRWHEYWRLASTWFIFNSILPVRWYPPSPRIPQFCCIPHLSSH